MILTWGIILIILRLLNVIFHCLGCILLVSQYRNGEDTPQQLFLINFSSIKAIQNLMTIFMSPWSDMISLSDSVLQHVDMFQEYFVIIIEILIWLMYHVNMLYMTIDRMLAIWLNLKYSLYCTLSRAKYLIICTWITSVLFLLIIMFMYAFKVTDYYPYIWYMYLSFDIAFVTVATITYTFIFQKYRHTRREPPQYTHTSANVQQPSLFQVFRKSRFYIAVLLISNFLIFKVIADFLFFFIGVVAKNDTPVTNITTFTMWALSDLLDAWIYIFVHKPIREVLKRKLRIENSCGELFQCRMDCVARRTQTIVPRV